MTTTGRTVVDQLPPCILTLDVEEWFHAHNYAVKVDARSWEGRERRAHTGVSRLLDLCDALQLRATWFVLGWLAEREPALVRRIVAAGHEVGCHTYAHPVAYELTPAQFRDDVRRGRDAVAQAVGQPPSCYRAASFTIVARNYWALEILREEGFRVDSSLFPVRHPRYGNPRGPRAPFILGEARAAGLLVLPMTTLRLAGSNFPFSGGGYFRLLPLSVLRTCIQHVRRTQREPVVFYFHPWELDAFTPEVDLGRLQNLRSQGGKKDLHAKLERTLRGLPALTLGEWAERVRPMAPLVSGVDRLPG
jgi:polysaccharide deacetylase family protein (PEP-CTERM system associated)